MIFHVMFIERGTISAGPAIDIQYDRTPGWIGTGCVDSDLPISDEAEVKVSGRG